MTNKLVTILKNRESEISKQLEELIKEKEALVTLLELYGGNPSEPLPTVGKKIVIDESVANVEPTESKQVEPIAVKKAKRKKRKKLDIKTVAAIKAELNEGKISEKEIIEKYDTNSGTIWRIKTERIHKDVAPAAMTQEQAEAKMVEQQVDQERRSNESNSFFGSKPTAPKFPQLKSQ